jgi:FHS family L-fucose permease-like MFS transporter
LFFMWGFAYGFWMFSTSIFRRHSILRQLRLQASRRMSLLPMPAFYQYLTTFSAYFGAYFIGPLTYSGWIVRKFGYR